MVSGSQHADQCVLGGHAAGEGEAVGGSLQSGHAALQRGPRGVGGAGVLVAEVLARGGLHVSGGQMDGDSDGPGGLVGLLADMHGPGFEPPVLAAVHHSAFWAPSPSDLEDR